MSELTNHYQTEQPAAGSGCIFPAGCPAVWQEMPYTHSMVPAGRGWLGWITEQPPRTCCSFTEVKKERSQAQTSLPLKGPTLRLKTSSTLAHEVQGCHREPAAQGTQCHEDARHFPANSVGLLSKYHVYLQAKAVGNISGEHLFFISWGVLNEEMLNNFCGLGSSYWSPFPLPFPMICSDAREEVFIILSNLVFTMPALSQQPSELSTNLLK